MTTTALARRFTMDVDSNYPAAATWIELMGITELTPKVEATVQESDDYNSDGWGGVEKTMQKWTVEVTVFRKLDAVGAFDAAQEVLRACEDKFGVDARAHIRWYDSNGAAEAFEGTGIVQWERANSGVADLDGAKITITGDGARTAITNPLA